MAQELKDLNKITGIYKDEYGLIIRITEKDGSFYRELYKKDPVKLIHEKGGLFHYETIKDLKINFEHIGTKEEQFTLYMSSQSPSTYRKISAIDMNDINKVELNGRYVNDETETEIILEHKEGNYYPLTNKRPLVKLLKNSLTENTTPSFLLISFKLDQEPV